MSGWTGAMIADARRMNDEGLSRAQIAAALSKTYKREFTRNAVIGKLNRMGITVPAPEPCRLADERILAALQDMERGVAAKRAARVQGAPYYEVRRCWAEAQA